MARLSSHLLLLLCSVFATRAFAGPADPDALYIGSASDADDLAQPDDEEAPLVVPPKKAKLSPPRQKALRKTVRGARLTKESWLVELEAFGGALGPVTYDRAPGSSPTGASADRQIASYGGGVRVVRTFGSSAAVPLDWYVRALWRQFQPTENSYETRIEGTKAVVGQATQRLSAQGPGLGLGIERQALNGRWFLPFIGAVYEQSHVAMQGAVPTADHQSREDVDQKSTLHIMYGETGVNFRLWSGTRTSVTLRSSILLPFYQNGTRSTDGGADANETAAVAAIKRLNHRATPGAEMSFGIGFVP